MKRVLCFGVLLCTLAVSLTACGLRMMSGREVERRLSERYDGAFTVVSAENVPVDGFGMGAWRVKAFMVSPKDAPETRFPAFNILSFAGSNSVVSFDNYLSDTYAADLLCAAFEQRAAEVSLDYELRYAYPVASSSAYYWDHCIDIEVSPENLENVCEAMALTFADILETIPSLEEKSSGVEFYLLYAEPEWAAEERCPISITPFVNRYRVGLSAFERRAVTADAASIRAGIMTEVEWYRQQRFLSESEMERQLRQKYGRAFTVTASEKISSTDFEPQSWGVKAYVVSPADAPERTFFAYDQLAYRYRDGKMVGYDRLLKDTYAFDFFDAALKTHAASLDYETKRLHAAWRTSTDYDTGLRVIMAVSPADLDAACAALAAAVGDTLQAVPALDGASGNMEIVLVYREPDWRADESCRIRIGLFDERYRDTQTDEAARQTVTADVQALRERVEKEVCAYRAQMQAAK